MMADDEMVIGAMVDVIRWFGWDTKIDMLVSCGSSWSWEPHGHDLFSHMTLVLFWSGNAIIFHPFIIQI